MGRSELAAGQGRRFIEAMVAGALLVAFHGHAHDPGKEESGGSRATATVTVDGEYRLIEADGIPDHATGEFPNRGNPNRISPQRYRFRVPLHPRVAETTTPLKMQPFGIALNGIPFDPGAAEFWNGDWASGWQYEAMSGAVPLGIDGSNAHVQPTGAYHYHGIPTGLLKRLETTTGPVLLGYAADGFPIYGPQGYAVAGDSRSALRQLRSSYRLREGTRPTGPGGKYDGSFVQDYEYVTGAGDLDECNGRQGVTPEYPQGIYHYVLTDRFPFIPRLFRGTPDRSFERRPMPPGGGRGRHRPPPFGARQGVPRGQDAPHGMPGERGDFPSDSLLHQPPGDSSRDHVFPPPPELTWDRASDFPPPPPPFPSPAQEGEYGGEHETFPGPRTFRRRPPPPPHGQGEE